MKEATRDRRQPAEIALALVAGWLIPGAGHFLLGRRRLGLAFLTIVAIMIALGVGLAGELYAFDSPDRLSKLGALAEASLGVPYLVLELGLRYEGKIREVGYSYGTAFLLTAGLMNILLLLDVYDRAVGRKE
ncbi:MAG TPA: DUF6677 family protein [Thermoanaerobaculia bacterium]|nr:DUF6677 family protein [Thermoanaerobaculia bacterium]